MGRLRDAEAEIPAGITLRVISGVQRDRSFQIRGRTILGRDPACDLPLEDRKASRRHCALELRDGAWWIEDLRSANGTWLNGDRTAGRRVGPGDVLKIGDTVLEVVDPAAAGVPPGPERREPPREHRPAPEAAGGGARRRPSSVGVYVVALTLAAAGAVGVAIYVRESAGPSPPQPAGRTPERDRASTAGAEEASNAGAEGASGDETALARGPEPQPAPAQARPPRSPGNQPEGKPLRGTASAGGEDFREALASLERRASSLPAEDFQREVSRIFDAARAWLDRAVRESEQLVRAGDFGLARERMLAVIPVLPDGLDDRAIEELERLSELAAERLRGDEVSEDLSLPVRDAIARLDFAAALLAARSSRMPAAERADLENEVEWTKRAWGAIQKASSALASGAPVRLAWAPGRSRVVREEGRLRRTGPLPEGEYRILGVSGGELRVTGTEGEDSIDLFLLADEVLGRLVFSAALEDSENDVPVRERSKELTAGAALLLLYREGPFRARRFLDTLGLPLDERLELQGRVDSFRQFWLESRRRAITTDLERLDPAANAKDWAALSERAAELIVLWRERQGFTGVREQLIELFRRVRLESLRRSDADARRFFHARRVELEGDRLRLFYDFVDPRELQDLRPVGESSVRHAPGRLVARGEFRLLDGDPFADSLRVRVEVPAGGYRSEAPNVNIALWTTDKDRVSPAGTLTLTRSMIRGRQGPAGYIVCATGYRTAVTEYGGTRLEEVKPAGAKDPIRLPAHVLFGGEAGLPLHSEPDECLWAQRIDPPRLRGALAIEIRMDEAALSWTVNSRSILPAEIPSRGRIFLAGGRRGSVSIFSLGHDLQIASLEVEGTTNSGWFEAAFEAALEREVDELLR